MPCVELEGRQATPDHACVVPRVTLNRPHLRPCHGSQCVKTAAVKVIGVATGRLCVWTRPFILVAGWSWKPGFWVSTRKYRAHRLLLL